MIYVYTDGSWKKEKSKTSAWAFVVLQVLETDNYLPPKYEKPEKKFTYEIFYDRGTEPNSTIVRAELLALYESLIWLTDMTPFDDDIKIYIDNQSVYETFKEIKYSERTKDIVYGNSYLGGWRRNNYKKKFNEEIQNLDIIQDIELYLRDLLLGGYIITLESIRSHGKGKILYMGNERADFLAKDILDKTIEKE